MTGARPTRGERSGATRVRERLSYANVMSTIAVFGVLGGGAYATHTHKVGTKDLRKRTVATNKVKMRAVKTPLIADGAVKRRTIGNATVTAGKLGEIVIRSSGQQTVEDDRMDFATASCEEDETLISGGGAITPFVGGPAEDFAIVRSEKVEQPTQGWEVAVVNTSGDSQTFRAEAYCLQP